MEVYEMNLNKTEKHVKKEGDLALNLRLGATARSKTERSNLHSRVDLIKSSHYGDESRTILFEAEVKRSQAFELFHRLQNC
jgi:hypothetical protein